MMEQAQEIPGKPTNRTLIKAHKKENLFRPKK
jgi:hypothetical protein